MRITLAWRRIFPAAGVFAAGILAVTVRSGAAASPIGPVDESGHGDPPPVGGTARIAGLHAADLPGDPVLEALVREALARSPELAGALADVAAERERAPQAGALPDPTLSLGIQNDGFQGIQIGTEETSFWQVMVTQPLPGRCKRGLRAAAARSTADAAAARVERIRLTTAADVERAYVDLLLAREQMRLLDWLEGLWQEAESMARVRYEVGSVPQSDLVRTQLERTRLARQRIAIEATERMLLHRLNRLRLHPLDEPLATSMGLADEALPRLPEVADAVADAAARSPELAQARIAVEASQRRVALAQRERRPDFAVTGGIMPRGGLEPMWLASVGITLPVFSQRGRAVTEWTHRSEATRHGETALARTLELRTRDRHVTLEALLRTALLYRQTLLVQSDAALRSTLSQYGVGRSPFAAVLEVMSGLVRDEGGFLEVLAQARHAAIALREVSLDGSEIAGGPAGGSVPGSAGGMAGGGRSRTQAGAASEAATEGADSGRAGGAPMSGM